MSLNDLTSFALVMLANKFFINVFDYVQKRTDATFPAAYYYRIPTSASRKKG